MSKKTYLISVSIVFSIFAALMVWNPTVFAYVYFIYNLMAFLSILYVMRANRIYNNQQISRYQFLFKVTYMMENEIVSFDSYHHNNFIKNLQGTFQFPRFNPFVIITLWPYEMVILFKNPNAYFERRP